MRWLLLRGLVREKAHWGRFMALLENEFPGHTFNYLEIPGNGESFREKSPSSIPAIVDTLRAGWLKGKTDEPQMILALSLGAMVATDWLKRYPQDFSGAVLMNASLRGYSPFSKRLQWKLYPTILRLLISSDAALVEKTILGIVSNRHGMDPRLIDKWIKIQQQRPVSRSNAVRQILSAAKYKAPSERPSAVPILVVCGQGDRLAHPDCSEAIAKRWSAPLIAHPTAGHDITLDEPEWVIQELKSWLEREFKS